MEEEIGEKIVTPLTPQELCASWPRRRRVAVSVHWLGALIPSLPSSTQFQFQELLPKKEGCSERPVVWSPDTNIILLTRASLSLTTTYGGLVWNMTY